MNKFNTKTPVKILTGSRKGRLGIIETVIPQRTLTESLDDTLEQWYEVNLDNGTTFTFHEAQLHEEPSTIFESVMNEFLTNKKAKAPKKIVEPSQPSDYKEYDESVYQFILDNNLPAGFHLFSEDYQRKYLASKNIPYLEALQTPINGEYLTEDHD